MIRRGVSAIDEASNASRDASIWPPRREAGRSPSPPVDFPALLFLLSGRISEIRVRKMQPDA